MVMWNRIAGARLVGGATAVLALLITPPAQAADGGLLRVTADGDGGQVFIDGKDTGQATPSTLDGISPGQHRIEVMGTCSRGSATVNVRRPGVTQADITMQPATGTLVILPNPADATVSLDGAAIQAGSDVVVPCGAHAVNVSLDGHLPAVLTLDVGMDEIVELPVTLSPLGRGTLSVNVTPASARVLLDGDPIGTGPVPSYDVVAGPHVLRVEADGYTAAERQFQLADGATRQFVLSLEAAAPAPVARRGGGNGGKIAGWGLTAAGVGALGYAAYAGAATAREYSTYQEAVSDGAFDQGEADDYFQDTIVPRRSAFYAGLGAGAALLAGGVTLVVVF